MASLKGFWQFLNTDVRDIPWGDLAETGIEAASTTKDLRETWKNQVPNIKPVQPYINQVEFFINTLDSPVTQLAISGLPFLSIGIGLLKIYMSLAGQKPTYENSVIILAQLAYLQSLEEVLNRFVSTDIFKNLETVSLKSLIEKQLVCLDSVEFNTTELKTVTSRFRESLLADKFSQILTNQLQQSDVEKKDTKQLVEEVAWGTHRYFHKAIAETGTSIEPLTELYRAGGQQIQDRYDSIDNYLNEVIAPLPKGRVFDENNPLITFQEIYVPLKVQLLTKGHLYLLDFGRAESHMRLLFISFSRG